MNSLEKPIFKASDIKKGLGLSYRQLHNWNEKGVLPTGRKDKPGWHTFSLQKFFVLMICKEIKDYYGVPLELLEYVKSTMLKKGADYFSYAYTTMKKGLSVCLFTDLRKTFIIDTDLEIQDLLENGFFRSERPKRFIVMNVNPIINQMLHLEGLSLKINQAIYDSFDDFDKQRTANTQKEVEALKIIRNKDYKRIQLYRADNGELEQIDTEEELSEKAKNVQQNKIEKLIEEKKFQTIIIQKHDGKIVRLVRKSPIKLGGVTEKS